MDLYDVWNDSITDIKQQVTGVNVWTAINCAVPVTVDDGILVLGLQHKDTGLKGHLNMAGTKRAIEEECSKRYGEDLQVRVIEGITINDWSAEKSRDDQVDRMKTEAAVRDHERAAVQTRWDEVFEELSREYARTPNKGLAQNRANLLERCTEICAAGLSGEDMDEHEQRAFARCMERVGSYCDVSSVLAAYLTLQRAAKK